MPIYSQAEGVPLGVSAPIGILTKNAAGNAAIGTLMLSRAAFYNWENRINPGGDWYSVPVYRDSSVHLRCLFAYLNALSKSKRFAGYGDSAWHNPVFGDGHEWRVP